MLLNTILYIGALPDREKCCTMKRETCLKHKNASVKKLWCWNVKKDNRDLFLKVDSSFLQSLYTCSQIIITFPKRSGCIMLHKVEYFPFLKSCKALSANTSGLLFFMSSSIRASHFACSYSKNQFLNFTKSSAESRLPNFLIHEVSASKVIWPNLLIKICVIQCNLLTESLSNRCHNRSWHITRPVALTAHD